MTASQGNTPTRAIRIPDDLWHAAQTAANQNGESVSTVIRGALTRYVKTTEQKKTRVTRDTPTNEVAPPHDFK